MNLCHAGLVICVTLISTTAARAQDYSATSWAVSNSISGSGSNQSVSVTMTASGPNAVQEMALALAQMVARTNNIKYISGYNLSGRATTAADYAGQIVRDDGGSLYVAYSTTPGDLGAMGFSAGLRQIGSPTNMDSHFGGGSLKVFINGNPRFQQTTQWQGDGGIWLVNMNPWQSGSSYFMARSGTDANGTPQVFDPVAGGFTYVPTNRFWTPAGFSDSAGRYELVFNPSPGVSNAPTGFGIARAGYGSPGGNYELTSWDLDNHITHFGRYVPGAFFPGIGNWQDVMTVYGAENRMTVNGQLRVTTNMVIAGTNLIIRSVDDSNVYVRIWANSKGKISGQVVAP